MSLRRRPAEAATYIPATTTLSGFGITSSGAIGFSEDVERRISTANAFSMAKAPAPAAAAASTEAATTATAAATTTEAGVQSNRDAIAMIRPYASLTGRSFLAHDDEEEDAVNLGLPFKPLSKGSKEYHDKLAKNTTDVNMFTRNYRRLEHKLIAEEYFKFSSGGKCRSVDDFVRLQMEIPHNIFHAYRNLQTKHSMESVSKKLISEIERLYRLCTTVEDYWNMSNQDLPRNVHFTYEKYLMNSSSAAGQYFATCMKKYKEAENVVKKIDRLMDVGGYHHMHSHHVGEHHGNGEHHQQHGEKHKKKNNKKEHHDKDNKQELHIHIHKEEDSSKKHGPEKKHTAPHPGDKHDAKNHSAPHEDDKPKDNKKAVKKASKMVEALNLMRPGKTKSVGSEMTSVAEMREAIRAKTLEIQQRLDAQRKDLALSSSAMYCQCSDPVPVSSSTYCQCSDPVPVSSSMYCQCSDPVPCVATATHAGHHDHPHNQKEEHKKAKKAKKPTPAPSHNHAKRQLDMHAAHNLAHRTNTNSKISMGSYLFPDDDDF